MVLFLNAIAGGLVNGLTILGRITLIVIPIIVSMELARHFRLLNKLQARLGGSMRVLKLPPQAAFPLLIGMFFGLLYGAALIIDYVREGYLAPRDVTILTIFLSLNHSIVEDTALFASVGANPTILFLFRLALAIICTRFIAYIIDFRARSDNKWEKLEEGD